jgi:hypothetical protein
MTSDSTRAPGIGDDVIDLNAATRIGHGWKRYCYIHPNDPTRCIKVGFGSKTTGWGWRDRLTTLRLDRGAGEVLNRREWRAYNNIGATLADYVPRYHGPITTSLGNGLEVDLIRDADGTPSKQLRPWLIASTAEEGERLLTQFDTLFDLLFSHEIWLFDLNLSNFVVQVTGETVPRVWLIDLKRIADSKEILQVTSWTRGQKRRKLARRIAQFHNKFEIERNFDPDGPPSTWRRKARLKYGQQS